MLFVIFFLVDDDVAVNEQIVEEEELPGFRLLPARFRQHALAN
jgi:hypothetical protein